MLSDEQVVEIEKCANNAPGRACGQCSFRRGCQDEAQLALLADRAELKAEVERLRQQMQYTVDQGHNDDCLFCGLKDKRLLAALEDGVRADA